MNFRLLGRLFVTFLILGSCIKQSGYQNSNTDLEQWKLKGNVKSLTEIDYSKSGKYTAQLFFTNNGLIKQQSSFNPDGTLIRKWVFTYNKNDLKLSRKCYILNDSLSNVMYYYYNQINKNSLILSCDATGNLSSRIMYTFDSRSNVIEEKTVDGGASLKKMSLHRYDKQNRLIEDVCIDSILKKNWKQEYSYNSGQLAEISYSSLQDSIINRKRFCYLANNRVYSVSFYDYRNNLISLTKYRYDNQGNAIEMIVYSPDGRIQEKRDYHYKYDNYDNWIFVSEFCNGLPEKVITRELKYYEK
jgi:hypothetical protein